MLGIGMMHMCELCHRHSDDLSHCRATDEYLCEPCLVVRAEEYLYADIADVGGEDAVDE